jgi:hypothetical protein
MQEEAKRRREGGVKGEPGVTERGEQEEEYRENKERKRKEKRSK